MNHVKQIIFLAMVVVIMFGCNNSSSNVTKVELKKNKSGYHRLYVNNKEFYVAGAGLEFGNVEALAEYGGNSFRTWRTSNESEDAIDVLDQALENGLLVLMGLDVERERHGFDYDDDESEMVILAHLLPFANFTENYGLNLLLGRLLG